MVSLAICFTKRSIYRFLIVDLLVFTGCFIMMIVLDTFHVMRHHHLTLKLITIFQLPFLIFRPRLCSPWSCFKGFITTLQTRHQRLAILVTAGLHSGDGGDTFTLQLLWGSKCFVLLGYGTSTTHIITLSFGLNPFGIKFICSH